MSFNPNLQRVNFNDFPNLRTVNLSTIGMENFAVPNFDLQLIDLSSNLLRNFSLFNAEEVMIRDNKVKVFNVPYYVDKVKFLDVRDNEIAQINVAHLSLMPNLRRFEFTGNPLRCDNFDAVLKAIYAPNVTFDRVFQLEWAVVIRINRKTRQVCYASVHIYIFDRTFTTPKITV